MKEFLFYVYVTYGDDSHPRRLDIRKSAETVEQALLRLLKDWAGNPSLVEIGYEDGEEGEAPDILFVWTRDNGLMYNSLDISEADILDAWLMGKTQE